MCKGWVGGRGGVGGVGGGGGKERGTERRDEAIGEAGEGRALQTAGASSRGRLQRKYTSTISTTKHKTKEERLGGEGRETEVFFAAVIADAAATSQDIIAKTTTISYIFGYIVFFWL